MNKEFNGSCGGVARAEWAERVSNGARKGDAGLQGAS